MGKKSWEYLKAFAKTTYFDLALIFMIGLLPLTWFRGAVIAGMDLPWPMLNAQYVAKTAFYVWNPTQCLGAQDIYSRPLTYFLGNFGLSKLGLSTLTIDKLWFVFWFAGAGLSAYFLIRVLVPRHRLAAVIGALFYMLNPFTMIVRWHELNLWLFFYAMVPLLWAFFALLIRTGKLRYLAGFLVAALLFSPSHTNLGSLVMLAIILGGYLIVYLIQNRQARQKVLLALRYTLILIILWVAVNMWWILPSATSLRHEAGLVQEPGNTVQLAEMISKESTWDRVLRLQGYWAFSIDYSGTDDPVISYTKTYDSSLIAVLGWIIPILALAGVLMMRRYKGLVWPAFLWLGSLFFMKGVQAPFGGLIKWMYQSLPGMSIFRNPFDKFGMLAVLAMAPLVGVGLEGLYQFIRHRMKEGWASKAISYSALSATGVVLLVVLVWPMWTGDVIYAGGQVMPSMRIKDSPSDYEEARSWLADQEGEFRILPIPYNVGFWTLALFDWYIGHDPSSLMLESNLATPSFGFPGSDFTEAAANEVIGGEPDAASLCSLLNIKYVLLREDANWDVINDYQSDLSIGYIGASLPVMQQTLNSQTWLEPVAHFGRLVFYLNRDWQPLQAYAALSSSKVDAEAKNLAGGSSDQIGGRTGQTFGQVDWSEDSGNIRVTSLSDQGPTWVGIREAIELGDGPVPYSFKMKTNDTSQAHVKVQWYDKDNQLLADELLEAGIDGSTDWTEYSGLLPKPPDSDHGDLVIQMHPRKDATMEVTDVSFKIQPLGKVDWSEDSAGNISIKSLSDDDEEWVGIRKALDLGDGPFPYSYQFKTRDAANAHPKIEWYDKNGKIVADYFLQMCVDGTSDWTRNSGLLPKPPGAERAELVIIMEPRKGATLEMKNLFISEQPWIQALSGDTGKANMGGGATTQGTNVLISGEDAVKLELGENPLPTVNPSTCTVQQSSPWSARVKVEAQGPCFLVLNQAFDQGWRAYLGSPGWAQILTGAKQLNARHFMANGYSNGWYIDKPGEYEITLYYRPQALLPLGAIISAVAWGLLVLWFILRRRSVRRRAETTEESSGR
jgi:hypothetical protein